MRTGGPLSLLSGAAPRQDAAATTLSRRAGFVDTQVAIDAVRHHVLSGLKPQPLVVQGDGHLVRFERDLYLFDFGAPIGFRIATRHPERVQGLVLQNGNAYQAGLGPGMQALKPYWDDRAANEAAIRGLLQLEATRSQYVDGVPDPTIVNPDLWELDQRYLELPGRDQVMLDLLYDYQANVKLYPRWREYLRTHTPAALLPWGRNDAFFPPAGARAYVDDLPDAELHLLDTGHFATATHSQEIAGLIRTFLDTQVAASSANRRLNGASAYRV